MTMENYQNERAVAVSAVREAAKLCQAVQATIDKEVIEKKDRTPVTVADFGSQALICRAIAEAFPDDPIIAEEDATTLRSDEAVLGQVVKRVQAIRPGASDDDVTAWIDRGDALEYHDRFWTLDPIDGTKGFLRGDQYAIALALIVDGQPQVSALCCPNLPQSFEDGQNTGFIFSAVRGEGAMQTPTNNADGTPLAIATSPVDKPSDARFCDSYVSAHSSHDAAMEVGEHLGITAEPIRVDSQAKYALVGRGNVEIYFRLPRTGDYTERIWDHAAGALVVEAAGGTVTDVNGDPLDFTHGYLLKENRGIVATNGRFHEEVLDALKAVGFVS